MFGNGRVFISHAHEDNAACETLLAALDAWEVNYWFDRQQLEAGQRYAGYIQTALGESDIFLRVCTPAALRSSWMAEEQRLAGFLAAPNRSKRRLIINLVLKPGYVAQPGEENNKVIDATRANQVIWLQLLRETLGVPSRERRMNRRSVLALGAVSVVTLGAMGYAADLFFTRSSANLFTPTVHQPAPTPLPGASRIRWTYTFPETTALLGYTDGVSLANGVVYCASFAAGGIVALNAKTGARVWQQQFDGLQSGAAPTIAGDTLYFPSTVEVYQPTTGGAFNSFKQSSLVALGTAAGSQLWSTLFATDSDNSGNAERFNSAVVVADNIAFLRSNQTIYAFNATTGVLLWHYSAGGPPSQNIAATLSGLPAPAVGVGAVYVVLGDGKLYAFNAADGKTLWPVPFAAAGAITTPPTFANGLVYTADTNGLGHIYALDAQTGQTRWKITLTKAASGTNSLGALTVSGLAVNNGAIYINTGFALGDDFSYQSTDSAAVTEARDAISGAKLWSAIPADSEKFPTDYFSDAMLGTPLIVGDIVYAVTRFHPSNDYNQNMVFALDTATGKSKWAVEFAGEPGNDFSSASVAGAAPSNLVASDDTLYISSGANTLYAIALDSAP